MFNEKANRIFELEGVVGIHLNTQAQLEEKIGQLDQEILVLRAHLEKADTSLAESQADLLENKSLLADLETDNDELVTEHAVLLDDFNEVSVAHKDLLHRYELLEQVLKQLHIPVTLPGKKK